ncbi:MAG: tRNA (adenine(22)-N(1))-methyltransferase TrmK [Gammaproteobacteria bacterium]|nr:tRNA (adenine(22)-N(1))-methyltransferase TrmK [Gammaproteobacteria bacterium]NNJ72450.1 methyltransferase [Enterobacterales bacterium]
MSVFAKENLDKFRQDMTVEYNWRDTPLRFKTTWGIFSPKTIDEGTRLMLSHLQVKEDDDCLDIGCGYGPLAICMAKAAHKGQTVAIDKDFVAVKYAQMNIQLNDLKNCHAMLSNGFDDIPEDQQFSLIVSNLPAKVGNEMLSLILHDAKQRLKPNGRLVVVHIGGLKNFIKRGFKEVFGNYKKIKQGKIYTVAQATYVPD